MCHINLIDGGKIIKFDCEIIHGFLDMEFETGFVLTGIVSNFSKFFLDFLDDAIGMSFRVGGD